MPPHRQRTRSPLTRPDVATLVPSDQTPGRQVTIGDFIVEQIRAGVDRNYAAATVGVTTQELAAWMREGALVFSRLNAGADWRKDFTRDQQDCAMFADKALRAVGQHIARLAIQAEQLARGGLQRSETRVKTDAAGRVLERQETTMTLLPDADMLRWKLERLAPQVYGSKATLNLTVTDLTDTDDEGDAMERRMTEVARALAIETTGEDVPGDDRS
jgi:hypothetical protein